MQAYYELVLGVDESVGLVIERLEDLGVLDQTLVILAGDNGYLLGEHRLLDKRAAYEESIRIPLLARYPAWFSGGERSDAMVLNIDIPATIMHAVGGEARSFTASSLPSGPAGFDRSLKVSADGGRRSSFLYEYFQEPTFPATPTMRAVRTPDFKYVAYDDPSQTDELYDLRADPSEMVNLIDSEQHGEVLAELRRELQDLRARTGDR